MAPQGVASATAGTADPPSLRVSLHLPSLLAYLLLALTMTWPLARQISTHLPMGDNDLLQNYWNFWWWNEALFELRQSPYHTNLLFHPEGTGLGLHTHSEANILLTLPINLAFGPGAALNTALLAGFIIGGFGAYLLAREYVPGRWAPFMAGLVYAFAPNHVEQSLEHVNLASIQGLPLALWGLIRAIRGTRFGWIGAGGFFAFNALLGLHNAFLAAPLMVAVAIHDIRLSRPPLRRVGTDLLKAACLSMLILAPFVWPVIHDALAQVGYFRKGVSSRAIDPLFLLIPHPGHVLWGRAVAGLYASYRTYPTVGFVAYLGVINVAIAAASFLPSRLFARGGAAGPGAESGHERRGFGFWSVCTGAFLLLSLGGCLTVAGRAYPSVPTLFGLLDWAPFVGMVRVPHRFLVPAVLSFALMVAYGADRILGRTPSRARQPIVVLLALGILLDLAWVPYPMQEVTVPGWVRVLDTLPPGLAVLDLPGGHRARASDDMYLQTIHGRPIAGGYVSVPIRHVSRRIREYPVLRRVFQARSSDTTFDGPGLIAALRALDVGIVVVHLDRTQEAIATKRGTTAARYPDDHYRVLPYAPDQGMPAALLERFRSVLRRRFGGPVHVSPGEVEIYVTFHETVRGPLRSPDALEAGAPARGARGAGDAGEPSRPRASLDTRS